MGARVPRRFCCRLIVSRKSGERETLHTHLAVDLDILDPSAVPDVSSPLKGGWSVETLTTTIQKS
ncbi:arginase family protein [Rhizobium sullae]|uniref:arginase family protein n=1 Tax=Rhizobium sullae TaxID=50338 RepID=UPI00117BBA7A